MKIKTKIKTKVTIQIFLLLLLAFLAYFVWLGTHSDSVSTAFSNKPQTELLKPTLDLKSTYLLNLNGVKTKLIADDKKNVKQHLLLHFWATWCSTCVEELPALIEFSKIIQSDNVQTVLVSVDDDSKEVVGFLKGLPKSLGTKFVDLILIDNPTNSLMKVFNIKKIPETFLINSDLKLIHHFVGPQDWTARSMTNFVKEKLK